jgi:hypothetical protein
MLGAHEKYPLVLERGLKACANGATGGGRVTERREWVLGTTAVVATVAEALEKGEDTRTHAMILEQITCYRGTGVASECRSS